MQVFIARQPIFDRVRRVVGYELLFRDSFENYFNASDPEKASAQVVANSSLVFDQKTLTDNRLAFVNATRGMLLGKGLGVLPPETTVIEVLETIAPTQDIISACESWKQAGYQVALDDFEYTKDHRPLIELADIIKIDLLNSDLRKRKTLLKLCQKKDIRTVAEKVENQQEFVQARDMGFDLFQGYFFAKPEILTKRDVPMHKLSYLHLLQQLQKIELDVNELAETIRRDVSLSYKLLKYINSAYFGLQGEIKSVQHALVILGDQDFRKWASVLVLAALADDKPQELVVRAIFRARFLESLAFLSRLEKRSQDLFLMGLFSLIDAILDQPLADILAELPIAADIKEGLLEFKGPLGEFFRACQAYERAQWDDFADLAKSLNLKEDAIPELYLSATQWSQMERS